MTVLQPVDDRTESRNVHQRRASLLAVLFKNPHPFNLEKAVIPVKNGTRTEPVRSRMCQS
jgi:hypothetical protein